MFYIFGNIYFVINHFAEIAEVWSRLFDHRPFLNGEIKFMLKEFEVHIFILKIINRDFNYDLNLVQI